MAKEEMIGVNMDIKDLKIPEESLSKKQKIN
jgi:hypothetical protein